MGPSFTVSGKFVADVQGWVKGTQTVIRSAVEAGRATAKANAESSRGLNEQQRELLATAKEYDRLAKAAQEAAKASRKAGFRSDPKEIDNAKKAAEALKSQAEAIDQVAKAAGKAQPALAAFGRTGRTTVRWFNGIESNARKAAVAITGIGAASALVTVALSRQTRGAAFDAVARGAKATVSSVNELVKSVPIVEGVMNRIATASNSLFTRTSSGLGSLAGQIAAKATTIAKTARSAIQAAVESPTNAPQRALARVAAGVKTITQTRPAQIARSAVSTGLETARSVATAPLRAVRSATDTATRITEGVTSIVQDLRPAGAAVAAFTSGAMAQLSKLAAAMSSGGLSAAVAGLAGKFGAMAGAIGPSMQALALYGKHAERVNNAVGLLTGGLSDQIRAFRESGGSITSMIGLTMSAMQQVGRFKRAYATQQERNPGGDPIQNITAAAKSVAATNLAVAGVNKLRNAFKSNNQEMDETVTRAQRVKSSLGSIAQVAGGVVIANAFTKVANSAYGFVRSTIEAGARSKELDIVLQRVGKTANLTAGQIEEQVEGLKAAGIESKTAKESISGFISAGLPVARAKELAQIAKDFAVIGQIDTSAAFEKILWGITTRQTDVLRTAGVTISFEQAFSEAAQKMGRTVSSLTEAEKTQIGFNAVVKSGTAVLGAYDAAMSTAGKQKRSLKRYTEELRNSLGTSLEPAYASIIKILGDTIKPGSKFAEMVKPNGVIGQGLKSLGAGAKNFFDGVHDSWLSFVGGFDPGKISSLFRSVNEEMGKALGPLSAAAAAGGAVKIASMIGPLRAMLGPIGALQAAFVTFVLTNDDMRKAAAKVFGALAQGAAMISASLLPLFGELADFVNDNADTMAGLVEQIATLITAAASLAAGLVSLLKGPLSGLLSVLSALLTAFAKIGGLETVAVAFFAAWSAAKFYGIASGIKETAEALGGLKKVGGFLSTAGDVLGAGLNGYLNTKAPQNAASKKAAVAEAVNIFSGFSLNRPAKAAAGADDAVKSTGRIRAAFSVLNAEAKRAATAARTVDAAVDTGAAVSKLAKLRNGFGALGTAATGAARAAAAGVTGIGVAAMGAAALALEAGILFAMYHHKRKRELEEEKKLVGQLGNEYESIAKFEGRATAIRVNVANLATARTKVQTLPKTLAAQIDDQGRANIAAEIARENPNLPSEERSRMLAERVAKLQASSSGEQEKVGNEAKAQGIALKAQVSSYSEELKTAYMATQDAAIKSAQAVSDSQAAVDVALKTSSGVFVDWSKLTSEQAMQLEERIVGLKNSAESWGASMTGFLGALSDPRVETTGGLIGYFDDVKQRVAAFWIDLGKLQKAGASSAVIDEFIAAGPDRAGAELHDFVAQLAAAGEEGAKAVLDTVNNSMSAVQRMNEEATTAIAKMWLESGKFARASTADQAAELGKALNQLQTSLLGEGEQLKGQAALLIGQINLADYDPKKKNLLAGMAEELAGEVDQAVAVLTDKRSTVAESTAAIADVMNIVQRMKDGGADQEVLDWITGLMNTMLGQKGQVAATAQGLGVSMDEGVAAGLQGGKAVNAAVLLRDKLGEILTGVSPEAQGAAVSEVSRDAAMANNHAADLRARKGTGAGPTSIETAITNSGITKADIDAADAYYAKQKDVTKAEKALAEAEQAAAAAQEAKAAKGPDYAKIAQDITESYTPLMLFNEGFEKAIGNMRAFQAAVDNTQDGIEGMARGLINLAASSDSPARKQRALRGEVDRLISGLRGETEAAVKAGTVANTTAAMTAYMKQRVVELKDSLPKLVSELKAGTGSVEDLEAAIGAAQKTLNEGLDVKLNLAEGIFGAQDALDALDERIKDQRALLTGVLLTDKDRRQIKTQTSRDLIAYVKALESEASVLARSGKIGADAASIQSHIREGLVKAKGLYPELSQEIDDYVSSLTEANAAAGKSSLELQVEAAIKELDNYATLLDEIPAAAQTVLQLKIDEASAQAAKQYMEALASDVENAAVTAARSALDKARKEAAVLKEGVSDAYKGVAPENIPAFNSEVHRDAMTAANYAANQRVPQAPPPPSSGIPASADNFDGWAQSASAASKATLSSAASFKQLVSAATQQALVMVKAGKINGDWASIQQVVVGLLKEAAKQYPEVTDEVTDYVNTVNSVPPSKITELQADSVGGQAVIESFKQVVETVPMVRETTIVAAITGADVSGLAQVVQGISGTWNISIQANVTDAMRKLERLAALAASVYFTQNQQSDVRALMANYQVDQGEASRLVLTGESTGLLRAIMDSGGPLKPGKSIIENQTGQEEWILNPQAMRAMMDLTGQASMPAAISAMKRMATMSLGTQPGVMNVSNIGAPTLPGASVEGQIKVEPRSGGATLDDVVVAIREMAKSGGNIEKVEVRTTENVGEVLEELMWRKVRGLP